MHIGSRLQFVLMFALTFCAGCNFGSSMSNLSTTIIQLYSSAVGVYRFNASEKYIISLLNVALLIGACIGSMSITHFMAQFGRKNVAVFCSFSACVVNLLVFAPVHWIYLFIVRIVLGIFSAALTTVVPAWIGEIASVRQRGVLNASFQIFTNTGILFSSLILLATNNIPNNYWFSFLVATICCGCSGLIAIFLPEGAAQQGFKKISADGLSQGNSEELSWGIFFSKKYARVVANVFLLNIAEQFSGINAVIMYSTLTFQEIFSSADEFTSSVYGSLIISCVNLLSSFVAIPLINKLGRRTLWFGGSGFCLLGLILFIITYSASFEQDVKTIVLIVSSIVFIFGFQVGPGPVFFVLASEIFPERLRSKCNGVTYTVNWVANIIIILVFPFFDNILWTFYLMVFLIMGGATVGLYFVVPETRGKTLHEIEAIMVPGEASQVENDVEF